MKENNRGSMIILTIIGIATLLVAVIGATFAYFTVQIQGDVGESTVQIESSTMLVTFENQNKIEYTGAIPGRPTEEDGIKNKLKFTLTSDPGLNIATRYQVILVIDSSNFLPTPSVSGNSANELVYVASQTGTQPEGVAIANPGQNAVIDYNLPQTITTVHNNLQSSPFEVGSFPSATLTTEDDPLTTDKNEEVITPVTNEKIVIGTGTLGSNGCIDSWEVEVWLKEIQSGQNYNQGKKLTAHIEIATEAISHEDIVTTP